MKKIISILALIVLLTGCSTIQGPPSLVGELQTQAQTVDPTTPTKLTDLGILRYGEKVLENWGMRSQNSSVLNTGGSIALAALSTGALAAGTTNPSVSNGFVAGFNFILQVLGIVKPAERNDARHEGAAMILDARGAFLEALAEKKIYVISNTRFTPQGALYFKQISAAQKIVDKLIVGLAPRIEDLEAVKPILPQKQSTPEPEKPEEVKSTPAAPTNTTAKEVTP